MKLYFSAWIAVVSLCLLSGCAYMQGVKDQKTTMQNSPPSGKQISLPEQASLPPANQTANPSATASKMIAPLTGAIN